MLYEIKKGREKEKNLSRIDRPLKAKGKTGELNAYSGGTAYAVGSSAMNINSWKQKDTVAAQLKSLLFQVDLKSGREYLSSKTIGFGRWEAYVSLQ